MTRYEMYIKDANEYVESAKDSKDFYSQDVFYRMSQTIKNNAEKLTLDKASEVIL